jgi:hypothetical protein
MTNHSRTYDRHKQDWIVTFCDTKDISATLRIFVCLSVSLFALNSKTNRSIFFKQSLSERKKS